MVTYADIHHKAKVRAFRRRTTRNRAASTIARGWKKRNRRRAGGLIARTAKSNYLMIRQLSSKREVKYMTQKVANETNNYTGQILAVGGLDSIGCENQLVNLSTNTPGVQGTIPATYSFYPVCLRPLLCVQGTDEGERLGEYINMKWITIKGWSSSYPASNNGTSSNGTVYTGRPAMQTVRLIVCLDQSPTKWDAGGPAAYQVAAAPGYIFRMGSMAGQYGVNPITSQKGQEYLRDGSKMPFGLTAADGSDDPWVQSYYENDFVCSKKFKKKRFKIIKVITLHTQQENANNAPNTIPSRANFSHTIKAPFRFQYHSEVDQLPGNQELVIFMASNVKIPISSNPLTTANPTIAAPRVFLTCKVAYTDS